MRESIERRTIPASGRRPMLRAPERSRTLACGAFVALMLGMAGCATVPAHVPVSGSASDVAQLAGDWSGEYWGGPSGRSGSITFQLGAGSDTAHGSVNMVARSATGVTSTPRTVAGEAGGTTVQELTVTFVHAEGGGVTGRLDAYTDPACNCAAYTTFDGRIKGDVVEGTFSTSHGAGSSVATGKWKVKRKKV
jgi:hypothetical protein